ncbi:hypothetical protein EP7_004808 [Isosphaeraceae bacterium EP7]
MTQEHDDGNSFAHRLTIFSTSGGMVGVCLTGIGLIGVLSHLRAVQTVAEELLAADALAFLTCSMLSFFALRDRSRRRRRVFDLTADIIFIIGLLLMMIVCALMALSID